MTSRPIGRWTFGRKGCPLIKDGFSVMHRRRPSCRARSLRSSLGAIWSAFDRHKYQLPIDELGTMAANARLSGRPAVNC